MAKQATVQKICTVEERAFADALDEMSDPAVESALEVQRLTARFNDLDGNYEIKKESPSKWYVEKEMNSIDSRVDILRDHITIVEATSLAGVLAQINEVSKRVALLTDNTQTEFQVREIRLAIDRMLYSIEGVIRRIAGAAATKIDPLEPYLDPRKPYDVCLSLIGDVAKAA